MKRSSLGILSLTLAAAMLAVGTLTVSDITQAAVPLKVAQVPGFYRAKVGAFEVTALLDGTGIFEPQWLKADHSTLEPLAAKHFQHADKLAGTVAAFLVNTGNDVILVDTGAGGFWGAPAFGHLTKNLLASGYRPEQVDLVLLTHLHADHVAGLRNADGKRKFPNATVSMLQADSDFWLSTEIGSKAPPEAKEFFDLAQASAKPYQAAGKWKPIAVGTEIVPGVRSRPIAGHTPGHTGYEFTSNGQSLLIIGDSVHVAQVQLERPDIGVVFDGDGPTSDNSRAALFEEVARAGQLVAGQHLPFPSLGRLRKEGAGYVWVPLPFSRTPQ
jgi:glyoxylase-like metal-dependent hydrolase (beta-lactamase superfamily II)